MRDFVRSTELLPATGSNTTASDRIKVLLIPFADGDSNLFLKMQFSSGIFIPFALLFTGCLHAQSYEEKSFAEIESFLDNTNDTLYIVNFWATWCRPCVEELPTFEKLQADHPELKVILVSLDGEKYWDSALQPFLEKNQIRSEVWVITGPKPIDWIDQIDPRWQGSIPATLFLNNVKEIKELKEKAFTREQLHETLLVIQQSMNSNQ
jgi:thiol-disulfide isomerase/thioredoxin